MSMPIIYIRPNQVYCIYSQPTMGLLIYSAARAYEEKHVLLPLPQPGASDQGAPLCNYFAIPLPLLP